ncbi:MAG TPA: glycosyltransferase family 2 protein [Thermoanaerobaculia bacterium]
MVELSIVMPVYNGESQLNSTLASITSQTFNNFELIVVDDGSTDGSAVILSEAARHDPRIRVIHQPNSGITRALIRGCSEAEAAVIARHDCGDRSMPERFVHQFELLSRGHVLVASATRFVEPAGLLLYDARGDGETIRRSLLGDPAGSIRGIPHHGSAMFRRETYRAAGSYRSQFHLAQDLDLWIRMARLGTIGVTTEILYEATVDEKSLSGTSRSEQIRLTAIATALREGGDEAVLLEAASRIRPAARSSSREAAALYFIGKCLLPRNPTEGQRYLRSALERDPFHLNARLSLWWTTLRSIGRG